MRAREEAILEALGVTRDQENPDLDAPWSLMGMSPPPLLEVAS